MANKKIVSGSEKQLLARRSLDADTLAQILAQPTWTPEQAEQILAAQVGSGLTIAQFAKQRGAFGGPAV